MNGQNALIDLRLQGYAPDACWVTLWNRTPVYRSTFDHPENALQNDFFPDIHVLPDENVNTLDFRCLRGLTVHLHSLCNADRTLDAFDRIMQFDPQIVVTCLEYPTHASLCIYEKGYPFREYTMEKRLAA